MKEGFMIQDATIMQEAAMMQATGHDAGDGP
jgi:hypothetical protein